MLCQRKESKKEFTSGRTLSAGTVQLRQLVFEPGILIPDHRHPEEVVTMVLDGTMEMTVGDETRKVTAGDVFRVPPETSHNGRVFSERVVAVSWSPVAQNGPIR